MSSDKFEKLYVYITDSKLKEETKKILEEHYEWIFKDTEDIYPVVWDEYGVLRFKTDTLVESLALKMNNLNKICYDMHQGLMTKQDWRRMNKRIGYSLSGFSDVTYDESQH